MNKALAVIGLVVLIIGALFAFSPALGRLAIGCTGDPFLSGVFTGRVTDSATGLGIGGASLAWVDPPYSNSAAGGTLADSSGYYYKFSMGSTNGPFKGCDQVQVTVIKTGSTYSTYTTTFQLPDNTCSPSGSACGSFTYGANYALTQAGSNPLTAAFTYVVSSLTVSFTDRTTGMPTAWNWVFADGYTSTQQNPTHTYSGGGSYDVTLTAYRSTDGVTSTATALINVVYGGTTQGQTGSPTCPTGYTGTYPNCTPPPYNPNQNPNQPPSNNTGNKTTLPTALSPAQWVGIGLAVVGLVAMVVSGLLPTIIFTGPYLHPEEARRQRR